MKTKSLITFTFLLFAFVWSTNILAQNIKTEYIIPELFITESTAEIKGDFDGDLETTTVFFQNEEFEFEADILEEEKNKIKIKTPPFSGLYNIIIDDGNADFFIEKTIHVADMHLTIGKTDLKRGQKTQLTITLSNISGFNNPIPVKINNLSTKTIQIDGGNNQLITLQNTQNQNSIEKQLEITALKRGNFNIEVNLQPNEIPISVTQQEIDNEIKTSFNDTTMVLALPNNDTLKFINDLFTEVNKTQAKPLTQEDYKKLAEDIRKAINKAQEETLGTTPKRFINRDFSKWIEQLLKSLPTNKKTETIKEGNKKSSITTTSGKKKYGKSKENPHDSVFCNCGIKGKIIHEIGKSFDLCKMLEKKEVAKQLKMKGLQFPEKDKTGFRGETVDLIPGMAYATASGDAVGGYANGIANMWGKEIEGMKAPKINFETSRIYAESKIVGTHFVEIARAPNEWSQVIGVVMVNSKTNAKTEDPLVFTRKLMKEFGRGKEELGFAYTVYSFINLAGIKNMLVAKVASVMSVISDLLGFGTEASGLASNQQKRVTTDTDASAYASTKYNVKVNNKYGRINKFSKSCKSAKINRHIKTEDIINLNYFRKNTNIDIKKCKKSYEKPKQRTIFVSDKHPTKVTASVTGNAKVRCKALGNGFAESGVESKTAVCVVGFCVNSNGGLKMKYIYDSGVFLCNKYAKEIADSETEKFKNSIEKYFSDFEKEMKGKSQYQIKNQITTWVEDDIKEKMKEWLN